MICRFLVGLVLVLSAAAASSAEPRFFPRRGLPQVVARAEATQASLRVAYLGGSITAAEDGWRSLTTAALRQRFPGATVVEIPAGVPGTGSDYGACRLERDVLRHDPDLLFVEFAVNDGSVAPERIERTMEGIVRQTWRAHPRTDICFVYTVSTASLADVQAGRLSAATRAMENVADHYGIPSLHLGVEVAARLKQRRLTFSGAPTTKDSSAPPLFSIDGVHPTAAGHRVYAEVVSTALPALLAVDAPERSALPAPRHADNWEHAMLRPIAEARRQGPWVQVPADDPGLRGTQWALVPPPWRTDQPGAALEFDVTGSIVGFVGIAAPDSGSFRVTVDDRAPVVVTFFDRFVSPTFYRLREWFYPDPLPAGPHRVRIELAETGPDKRAIKAAAGQSFDDPDPYRPNRLTLCGLLEVRP